MPDLYPVSRGFVECSRGLTMPDLNPVGKASFLIATEKWNGWLEETVLTEAGNGTLAFEKEKKMKIIVFERLSFKDTFYYQQDRISMLILNLSPCEFFDFSFKCGRSRGSNSMSLSSNQAPWIWFWKIAWRMHMTLFISSTKILNFLGAPRGP